MTLRMILVASVIQPELFISLLMGLLPMTFVGGLIVLILHWGARRSRGFSYRPENPFDLKIALFFGLGLAVVLLATRYLEDQIGVSGLLGLSFVTGIIDVDAIVISTSQLFNSGTSVKEIITAIIVAALANSVSKLFISVFFGGRVIYGVIIPAFSLFIVSGLSGVFIIRYFL